MRPAMIVLGLAVLILVVFVTIGIVSSQSPAPVKHAARRRASCRASPLRAAPAAEALAPIVSAGRAADQHPQRRVRPGRVASGSRTRTTRPASGQFDSQVTFRSDDSQAALLAFYAADMKLQGWQVFDRGPAANDPGALEVLGKLAGTDGYYWEMGVDHPADDVRPGRPAARCDALHRPPLPGARPATRRSGRVVRVGRRQACAAPRRRSPAAIGASGGSIVGLPAPARPAGRPRRRS